MKDSASHHESTKKWKSMALFLPLIVGCASPSNSELDEEVRRLCAIDGGVRVFETAPVPRGQFDVTGSLKIPPKAYASARDEYYYDSDTFYYQKGNPEMWRTEHRLIRARDKKVMGLRVIYTRRGGDLRLPSPMHESSFSCPRIGSRPSLEESVFVKGG